jgi:hypothetical protein
MQGTEPDQATAPPALDPLVSEVDAADSAGEGADDGPDDRADEAEPPEAAEAVAADETPPAPARPLRWIAFLVGTILVFGLVVAALNATLYSASGFVGRYLSALQRGDVGSAVSMPGVIVPGGAATVALTPQALDELSDVEVRADRVDAAGTHVIVVDYRMAGERRSSTFSVQRTAPLFAVFSGWRFTVSPIAAVPITVRNADSLTVDGISVEATPAEGGGTAIVAALTPSVLTLGSGDRYFSADPLDVPVVDAAAPASATLALEASPTFVDDVQTELDDFLDACITQTVLLPAGCPFGKSIEDRVLEPPTWTIVSYPPVVIEPADDGSWTVPDTIGTAHISVRVKSLFDGTTSTLDEDVTFDVSYRISVGPSGALIIDGS